MAQLKTAAGTRRSRYFTTIVFEARSGLWRLSVPDASDAEEFEEFRGLLKSVFIYAKIT
jgi:hypothetical protein